MPAPWPRQSSKELSPISRRRAAREGRALRDPLNSLDPEQDSDEPTFDKWFVRMDTAPGREGAVN